MVRSEILKRTFFVTTVDRRRCGSAFTVDINQRRYLVTADHVLPKTRRLGGIKVWHAMRWLDVQIREVGRMTGVEGDVAVFAPEPAIGPCIPLKMDSEGMILGDDVHFLGFPITQHGDPLGFDRNPGTNFNGGYPIPLVKRACIANFHGGRIYLDALVNPGFSGGPVVRYSFDRQQTIVIGVVSGYLTQHRVSGSSPPDTVENSGIVVANDASNALKIIEANPIGTTSRVCDKTCCPGAW